MLCLNVTESNDLHYIYTPIRKNRREEAKQHYFNFYSKVNVKWQPLTYKSLSLFNIIYILASKY